jgi:hypothetical protein
VPRCLWAVAASIALAAPAPFAFATVTPINTFGDGNGGERCLIGNASDRCTKGGTYLGAYSITALFSAWTGRSLARVDDDADQVWSAGSFGYIEVAGIAHYLSGHGTSSAGIWVDDGKFSGTELIPFPAGTEVSPPDNRTLGVVLPGEKRTGDILTGHVFDESFIALALGVASFEFVYGSGADYYSSDSTSRGFDNKVVSGKTLDHMVTWYAGQRIDSHQNIADVYLIAFERAQHDDDFQDGVYAVSIPVRAVPEPPAWMLLALGFGLTAWVRSRGTH